MYVCSPYDVVMFINDYQNRKNILVELLRQLEPKMVASIHIYVHGPNALATFINSYQSQTTIY